MPRKYRHIGDYEKEIIEMWTNGMTLRKIGERSGFGFDLLPLRT